MMGWQRKNKDKAKKMRTSKEVYKSVRKPTAPGSKVHKSKRDYNRREDTSLNDAYIDASEQLEEDIAFLRDVLGDDWE